MLRAVFSLTLPALHFGCCAEDSEGLGYKPCVYVSVCVCHSVCSCVRDTSFYATKSRRTEYTEFRWNKYLICYILLKGLWATSKIGFSVQVNLVVLTFSNEPNLSMSAIADTVYIKKQSVTLPYLIV